MLLCMYPETTNHITFDKVIAANNMLNMHPPDVAEARRKKLRVEFDDSYIEEEFYNSIDYRELAGCYYGRKVPLYWYRRYIATCFVVVGAFQGCDSVFKWLESMAYNSTGGALSLDKHALSSLYADTIERERGHCVPLQNGFDLTDAGIKLLRGAAANGTRYRLETCYKNFGCIRTNKIGVSI